MFINVTSVDHTWAFIAKVEILRKKSFRPIYLIKEIYINDNNSENDYRKLKKDDHVEIHLLFVQETKEDVIRSILC